MFKTIEELLEYLQEIDNFKTCDMEFITFNDIRLDYKFMSNEQISNKSNIERYSHKVWIDTSHFDNNGTYMYLNLYVWDLEELNINELIADIEVIKSVYDGL